MRRFLLLSLCLAFVALAPSWTADEAPAPRVAKDGAPHGDSPINQLCPVDGKQIDRDIQTVDAHLDQRVVWIGVCSDHCWHLVHAKPASYAQAALANTTAEKADEHRGGTVEQPATTAVPDGCMKPSDPN